MTIKVSSNEPIDSAVRRMSRYLENENLVETLQKRKQYRKKQQEEYMTKKLREKAKRRKRQAKRKMSVKGKPRR